jgi:hypothetical protein
MSSVRLIASVSLMFASSTALFSFAGRAQNATPSPYPGGFVIANSRFGNGTLRGQVRRAALGWKVQLPNRRWAYCRRSCSETLRVETIDFFESNAAGSGQLTNECGIFGCLDLKYRH